MDMAGEKLGPGDTFPSLSLKIAGGGEVVLPEAIETDFAVVLFYRGHW
jgi:peroxiredoxin